MDSIFGLSMNWVLIVLAGISLLCLASVALIGLLNPVVFKMAVRNPPRRKAQTGLIVVGLMLATLIISAALTTGDTLDYSLKKSAYDSLNRVDISIGFVGDTDDEGSLSVTNQPIPETIADDLTQQFADDPDFESFMPILTADVPVVNSDAQLSQPSAILTGLDWTKAEEVGGINEVGGGSIDLASIPAGSAIVSETLAEDVGTSAGDTITIYVENEPVEVPVAAVGDDSILTGLSFGTAEGPSNEGLVMSLDDVQQLTGLEGQARYIAVTLPGGVEGSVEHSEAAESKLEDALAGSELGVNPVKRETVDIAEQSGSQFVSFFLILGLFSIAAGVLLIFLIFMMLAAERRSEMGMARAVGMRQSNLVQQFLTEGAVYDLGAALVGATAGVLIAFVMVGLLNSFVGEFFTIEPRWTFRSMAVAYTLGVTVTFITIIFASLRAARLNIVSAIRDLPEPAGRQGDRARWTWWKRLPRFGRQFGSRGVHLVAILWFPFELVINLFLYPFRAIVFGIRVLAYFMGWGPLLTVVGALFMLFGWSRADSGFSMAPYALGFSLAGFGLMMILRRWFPQRIVFTAISAFMLFWWLGIESETLGGIVDIFTPANLEGDFEMFFVSGVMMITYTTLLVMWNAEVIVWLVSLFGKLFARWVPAVKTAVAYPLASKTKTGLTLAMFSLIVFSLVMMATMNANFVELFSTKEATAGWDVQVETSAANPVDDLPGSLEGSEVDTSEISAVGHVAVIVPENSQVREAGTIEWKRKAINGVDSAYASDTEMPLSVRATGYDSDQAVWDAVANDPTVAVVDSTTAGEGGGPFGGGGEDQFSIPGIDQDVPTMEPIEIEMASPSSDETRTITIIGIIKSSISTAQGIYLNEQTVTDLYGGADRQEIYVMLENDSLEHSQDVAKQIEAGLLDFGVQAESMEEQVEEMAETSSGFLNLIQGFMGLGLLVGIAALGVISFRAVVERRQQVGMLRAIGFQKNMVAVSFLLESLVVAGLGVLAGVALGLALAYNLISSGEIESGASFDGFIIPWLRLAVMIAIAIGAAALMTIIPARNAASTPVAEALRYE